MIEIILIIVGVIFIIVSFFVQEKLTGKDVQTIPDMSEKVVVCVKRYVR